eukprot:TRINITY_DN16363_c0_g1_i1.p1 TRINITY_DN16363_c0_g1~~TRINITY_DN16363_c0_g1_i1.p1  ORF type:complete len:101 (+),score=8.51 TRINITY_DN16363_c0_g1_i1:24-326(+)
MYIELHAAMSAAPTPDPSLVNTNLVWRYASSPKRSNRAECNERLNLGMSSYRAPSIATQVRLILFVISFLILPPDTPWAPSLPSFLSIPTMPDAARRAAP